MSGPKCDFFVLNEEEVERQRREQEARLQEIQRKRQLEEQRKKRQQEEQRKKIVKKETDETLALLQEISVDSKKKEFDEVYCEYSAVAELAGKEAECFVYSEEKASFFIDTMKHAMDDWKKEDMEHQCAKRVNEIIDETIEEMGYELIGEKESTNHTQTSAKIYQYDEDTAISVIESDGQFTMEVVAVDSVDRTVTQEEGVQLESSMVAFCKDYEQLMQRLAAKNVCNTKNVLHLPPNKMYARVVNASSYQKKRKKKAYSEDYTKETEWKMQYGKKEF